MLVSVVIPTQSRTDMLREAADSVLAQTFQDFELIIVPNAATAECEGVARAIASEHPNVRVISIKRGNLAGARNAGIAAAKGEWVSFLDDDDRWVATKLELQLRLADETKAKMIASPAVAFSRTGVIGLYANYPPPNLTLRQALTVYNWLPGSASGALVRADVLREAGGFDDSLVACEDWDLWRRIAWRHSIAVPDTPLVHWRMHKSNMSRGHLRMAAAELRHLLKMTLDSPSELRPMVCRAWLYYFSRGMRLLWRTPLRMRA